MRRVIFIIILLIFCSTSYADTLLVGGDPATDYGPTCWTDNSTTIESGSWKASRYQAKASGTIGYFAIRAPDTPTGCTSDSGCWAIYEAGTSSSVGDLKAYTCFSGYDWTTIGAGVHTFAVENTVTNLSVTSGTYYWLVFWSWGVDLTYYGSANCSSQILAYRGKNDSGCFSYYGLDQSVAASHGETTTTVSAPPAGSAYDIPLATYMLWGVFEGESEPVSQGQAVGVTISGGSIQ